MPDVERALSAYAGASTALSNVVCVSRSSVRRKAWANGLLPISLSAELRIDPICAGQGPSGEAAGGGRRLAGDGPKAESVRGVVSPLQFLQAGVACPARSCIAGSACQQKRIPERFKRGSDGEEHDRQRGRRLCTTSQTRDKIRRVIPSGVTNHFEGKKQKCGRDVERLPERRARLAYCGSALLIAPIRSCARNGLRRYATQPLAKASS